MLYARKRMWLPGSIETGLCLMWTATSLFGGGIFLSLLDLLRLRCYFTTTMKLKGKERRRKSYLLSFPFSFIVWVYSVSVLCFPEKSLVLIGSQKVCVLTVDKGFSLSLPFLSPSLLLLSRCYRCSISSSHCLHTFGFNYFGLLGNMLL